MDDIVDVVDIVVDVVIAATLAASELAALAASDVVKVEVSSPELDVSGIVLEAPVVVTLTCESLSGIAEVQLWSPLARWSSTWDQSEQRIKRFKQPATTQRARGHAMAEQSSHVDFFDGEI